jgi:hydrogenase maturation protease
MAKKQILVLGIGNILFTDEGFGIHVLYNLLRQYKFPPHVKLEDGGVLGLNLLSIISQPDYLIVVDAIRHTGKPGALYRLEKDDVPERIRAKNSLHQVDFLEALTLCQALDHVPETVILGVEPEDIETLATELTATTQAKVEPVVAMVLAELTRLGVEYEKGATEYVSCDPLKNRED